MKPLLIVVSLFSSSVLLLAQSAIDIPDIAKFEDSIRHWMNGPAAQVRYERFTPDQFREIADNLLKFQNPDGGWPKNVDWLAKLDRAAVFSKLTDHERPSTCDNRNIYSQIEYLSKAFLNTGDTKYRTGAARGLEFILNCRMPAAVGAVPTWTPPPLTMI